MKRAYFHFLFLLLASFSACKKENMCDCIKRTGKIITVTREVPPFDRIQVEQDVNVFITEDNVQEVKIEAGENIEPLIKMVVEDGILIIRNKNRCNWARSYDKPLNVYLRTPGLKYIISDGTGTIKSLNALTRDTLDVQIKNSGNVELTVDCNKVTSRVYGAGDITLNGNTIEHACSIGGASFIHAYGLNSSYTWIQSYTTGLSYVKASVNLTCRIDDIGDVHCKGNPPTVIKELNGNGKLLFE